jgi:hypothetical protein
MVFRLNIANEGRQIRILFHTLPTRNVYFVQMQIAEIIIWFKNNLLKVGWWTDDYCHCIGKNKKDDYLSTVFRKLSSSCDAVSKTK